MTSFGSGLSVRLRFVAGVARRKESEEKGYWIFSSSLSTIPTANRVVAGVAKRKESEERGSSITQPEKGVQSHSLRRIISSLS